MKKTKQRSVILESVLGSSDHPNADTIYNMVKFKLPHVSLGTVYRNLNLLSEEGLIKKIASPYGSDRFDKTLTDHYHMTCIKCSDCIDVMNVNLSNIKEFESITDCKVLDSVVLFYGLCSNCKGKED